ncbi:MAG: transcription elongation factor GreA [Acidimicrobiales bacterium]
MSEIRTDLDRSGLTRAGQGRAQRSQLSRSAYERLEEELHELTTTGRVEIARAIEAARALGDLSENGDYHAAKDAQGKMEARVRQVQALLASADIVDTTEDGSRVTAGSVVEIRYEGDDGSERYLVGSIEERPTGVSVVSPTSPLGRALMGHGPGDAVEYEAPSGVLRVEVVAVGA